MKGWEAIRDEVMGRVRARRWPPGALIPNEKVLATEFGVARATVNRALRELAEAGVLERRRRAGTRVAALPVRKATLDIPVIRQEVDPRGGRAGRRARHRAVRDRAHDMDRRGGHHLCPSGPCPRLPAADAGVTSGLMSAWPLALAR